MKRERKKIVCTDIAIGCDVNRKRRGERNRSRKIKVHVTLKDLGKSRQSLYVAFQYFLSSEEAKNSEHASASAFSTSKFTLARRGAGSSWKRISGRADSPSTFLAKTWTFCPSFREDRIPAKTFRWGVAVNAKLLRLFLWTRDSHRWTWRSYPSYVTIRDI